jgi:hypothetical protein
LKPLDKPHFPVRRAVFPKEGEESELQQWKSVKQFTKTVNKYMKRIADALELDIPLTTMAARHSFGTVLKNADAPDNLYSQIIYTLLFNFQLGVSMSL